MAAPTSEVELAIIGSGSGNSLLDDRFADRSVALIDEGTFGGTCLNVGCIPTKMFVLPADLAVTPRESSRLGVDLRLEATHFSQIRDRIFGRIDPISAAGLDWRQRQPWVQVKQSHARFLDSHTVELSDGSRVRAEQFVLAAGSRPRRLDLPGMAEAEAAHLVHTSNTIMRLAELPRRMIILGAGFIAVEFAHVFAAFGVEVTLVHRGDRLLRTADELVSTRLTAALGERIRLCLEQQVTGLESAAGEVSVLTTDSDGNRQRHVADIVLNATGRVPNGDLLEVARAEVAVDEAGYAVVDDHQRTSQPHIWAMGDISSPWQLKHVANHEMRVVQHNLLHPDDLISADHRFVPSAVFSHPQVASVGLTERQAAERGLPYLVQVQEYASVAYGWALEDSHHAVKLLADPTTRQLIGAHLIGPQAATLVQPCIQAMSLGIDLDTMARGQYWIHPALTEVVENAVLGLIAQLPSGSPLSRSDR